MSGLDVRDVTAMTVSELVQVQYQIDAELRQRRVTSAFKNLAKLHRAKAMTIPLEQREGELIRAIDKKNYAAIEDTLDILELLFETVTIK